MCACVSVCIGTVDEVLCFNWGSKNGEYQMYKRFYLSSTELQVVMIVGYPNCTALSSTFLGLYWRSNETS